MLTRLKQRLANRNTTVPDRRRRRVSPGTAFLYLVAIGFSTIGFAVGFNKIQFNHDQAVTSRQVAIRSKQVADGLAQVVTQIQNERRAGCEDLNRRHDQTVRRLEAIATANHISRARIAPTISLIDSLTPKRDCDHLVASKVPGSKLTP
jgi:hypothetical protein